jgi:hypothetical protein
MGLLAHNFSANRLRFFEMAKEKYETASRCLPLPLQCDSAANVNDTPNDSPLFIDTSPVVLNVGDVVVRDSSRAGIETGSKLAQSTTLGSLYSTASPTKIPRLSVREATSPGRPSPDHEISTPLNKQRKTSEGILRVPGESRENNTDDATALLNETPLQAVDESQLVPSAPGTYRTRLSRVLSSPRTLEEELVPSPLFSRGAKPAQLPSPPASTSNVALSRPLPPLPFNHNAASFIVSGNRVIQDPSILRKTAVQTLIARFEGIPPLPRTPLSAARYSYDVITPGIATPRFRMIRDAFSPDPDNPDLDTYLSSTTATLAAEIARYTEHLSDFRTHLEDHIAYIDAQSAATQKLQEERLAAKSLTSTKRFASYWSFPSPSSTTQAAVESGLDIFGDPFSEDHQNRKTNARSERVAKLKAEGWVVTKEKHGYKGLEFYDKFCRGVEADLSFAEC